jgi:hypothetical protein
VTTQNCEQRLSFSDDFLSAHVVSGLRDYRAAGRCIVVNLSSDPVPLAEAVRSSIPPWRSTILSDAVIASGERVACFRVMSETNIGGVAQRGWRWFGDKEPEFPRATPLYLSGQDSLGLVALDPSHFVGQTPYPKQTREFELKVNLWFCPGLTDCLIHTGHKFLEVHTQLLGLGHMQKFRENREATLYEDVLMQPGLTHEPFPTVVSDTDWHYPWHRYYGDTDCIWLAVELHLVS